MAMKDGTGKVVLVTGASSGIGKAIAERLIADGHTVYGAARRVGRMQDLVDAGGHAVELDVTDHDAVAAVVERVVGENGRIDVLVNNAGYATYGAVEDVPIDDARRQFEVNLFGLAAVTRAVLPHMRSRGSGTIINMSSMGGKVYTPLGAWYHATKHALEGWSDCLRLETKPFGIDVVVVEPGVIDTEFGEVLHEPLLERSGDGPYGGLARAIAKAVEGSYEEGDSSPPSVIADLVSKAIRADRPKTRYAAGKYARPMLWIRKWLGDRVFDRIVMSQLKRME